jgi:hypothetical protein
MGKSLLRGVGDIILSLGMEYWDLIVTSFKFISLLHQRDACAMLCPIQSMSSPAMRPYSSYLKAISNPMLALMRDTGKH